MRVAATRQNLFLVEGQTEEKLVKALYLGQVKVVDLWSLNNSKIDSINRSISKGTQVFVICDVDAINPTRCQNFLKNFQDIGKYVGRQNIAIIQQTNNFEHELLYCMSLRRKDLYEKFNNASGDAQLKKNFIAERKMLEKLMSNNFDINKLWSKSICSNLEELTDCKLTARDIRCLLRPDVIKQYPQLK